MIYPNAFVLTGSVDQFFGNDEIKHIADLTAAAADKMGVRRCFGIEPFLTVDDAYAGESSFLTEGGEVTVDGAKTQVGKLRLELLENPLRTGV